jgi:hypothetical protein
MRGPVTSMIATIAAALVAGCGSSTSTGVVPSLGPAGRPASATSTAGGTSRAAALHAAAQCVREHGIPSYPDPVLTADGKVYSDLQSFRLTSQATADAIQQSCGALLAAANFDPTAEPPAPPALVQAGVRAAGCMRAHGLPLVRDPSAQTLYAPGHGFGFGADELPQGGKFNPVFQRAAEACQALLDAEDRASTLPALGADG